ncbi:DUF4153 domain-containing protein [Bacillota bacterium]
MKRFSTMLYQMLKGLSAAVSRFSFTVASLVITAGLICYLISLDGKPPLALEKLIFVFGVGAFIGMVAQFSIEHFEKLRNKWLIAYGIALLLTAGYFATVWPSPVINAEIMTRSFVAVFAMTCAVLWIPAFRQRNDFNLVALLHFKSFFTAALYSAVLSAGFAAIFFAVDTLLFPVNDKSYSYMMTIVWIVFAPLYYLSLLPRFNNKEEEDKADSVYGGYPRFLEILVSYITIPLFAVFTIVLLAYSVKILATSQWPSGQLGPMVLVYSAVGVVLFVLASLPKNSFARLFRLLFPKIWIPIIIMQMISVWIRLDAYGITAARYYVSIFAVFSLVSAIFLSFRPVSRNRYIALLAAAFAIVSILPPLDAFSVSRNSQIDRIEAILQSEGMLSDGILTPKSTAAEETKKEVTNILQYLNSNSSTKYISWLPADFDMYLDMDESFGFEPYYVYNTDGDRRFFYASLDTELPLDISGYDISVVINSYLETGDKKVFAFEVGGRDYKLIAERISRSDMEITVEDGAGKPLINANFLTYALPMKDMTAAGKDIMPPDAMTNVESENGAELKIIFQHVSMENIGKQDFYADYAAYVLFKAP